MKIKSFQLYKVPPRWLFLKVETDEGLVGWGEPVVEGRADTVAAAVSELISMIGDKNILEIEDTWNLMYRGGFYRGGPVLMSAIAGIDQALWDIKGKFYNTPIHQLLGGKSRDKIEVYSWVGGDEPEILLDEVQRVYDKGFKTIKINGTGKLRFLDTYQEVDALLNRLGTLRDHFGMTLNIAIDFHGRVHLPMAKILMKELEEYRPIFVEEPLLSENLDSIAELNKRSNIPIALGERLYSRWDFKPVFERKIADIIQPDLSHAGGITECKKIANMAEAYDIALAPHCPLGPIALAACLQLDANAYNATIQEQSLGIHYNETNDLLDYITNSSVFDYENGLVKIPTGPGLGIEVNEEYVKQMATIGHNWHNPIWRHDDNTIAEW
ncbi:galactonate dehydratase [Sphingobacterium corticibacterium]|uniref:Galactonate dehydratase n=1 Tax=Sphingobacterium corticibacterium TaxID=2484746 RepID=A0A4Q6Y083_9SPHI|nr:galactonate dehydratase [Sphingobacterium corticibacterium]RZF62609.1 galactonate dehydratase [Sphingobacterium corticibacterium]